MFKQGRTSDGPQKRSGEGYQKRFGGEGHQKDARSPDPRKELLRRTISVSRVSKVSKGGKNFSFSVLCVVGDGKGRIGYGLGKAKEVSDAIKKANEIASKVMEKIPLKEGRTFHQDVTGHFGAGKVLIRSAPKGSGIIAGGSMRSIFEVMGARDVVAKSFRSNNPHNVIKATMKALKSIRSPRTVALDRGKKLQNILTPTMGEA